MLLLGLASSIYTATFIIRGLRLSNTIQPIERDWDTTVVRSGGGKEKFFGVEGDDLWPATAATDTKVDVEKDKEV